MKEDEKEVIWVDLEGDGKAPISIGAIKMGAIIIVALPEKRKEEKNEEKKFWRLMKKTFADQRV